MSVGISFDFNSLDKFEASIKKLKGSTDAANKIFESLSKNINKIDSSRLDSASQSMTTLVASVNNLKEGSFLRLSKAISEISNLRLSTLNKNLINLGQIDVSVLITSIKNIDAAFDNLKQKSINGIKEISIFIKKLDDLKELDLSKSSSALSQIGLSIKSITDSLKTFDTKSIDALRKFNTFLLRIKTFSPKVDQNTVDSVVKDIKIPLETLEVFFSKIGINSGNAFIDALEKALKIQSPSKEVLEVVKNIEMALETIVEKFEKIGASAAQGFLNQLDRTLANVTTSVRLVKLNEFLNLIKELSKTLNGVNVGTGFGLTIKRIAESIGLINNVSTLTFQAIAIKLSDFFKTFETLETSNVDKLSKLLNSLRRFFETDINIAKLDTLKEGLNNFFTPKENINDSITLFEKISSILGNSFFSGNLNINEENVEIFTKSFNTLVKSFDTINKMDLNEADLIRKVEGIKRLFSIFVGETRIERAFRVFNFFKSGNFDLSSIVRTLVPRGFVNLLNDLNVSSLDKVNILSNSVRNFVESMANLSRIDIDKTKALEAIVLFRELLTELTTAITGQKNVFLKGFSFLQSLNTKNPSVIFNSFISNFTKNNLIDRLNSIGKIDLNNIIRFISDISKFLNSLSRFKRQKVDVNTARRISETIRSVFSIFFGKSFLFFDNNIFKKIGRIKTEDVEKLESFTRGLVNVSRYLKNIDGTGTKNVGATIDAFEKSVDSVIRVAKKIKRMDLSNLKILADSFKKLTTSLKADLVINFNDDGTVKNVKDLITKTKKTIESEFGIQSPSRYMRRVGEDLTDGLEDGVEDIDEVITHPFQMSLDIINSIGRKFQRAIKRNIVSPALGLATVLATTFGAAFAVGFGFSVIDRALRKSFNSFFEATFNFREKYKKQIEQLSKITSQVANGIRGTFRELRNFLAFPIAVVVGGALTIVAAKLAVGFVETFASTLKRALPAIGNVFAASGKFALKVYTESFKRIGQFALKFFKGTFNNINEIFRNIKRSVDLIKNAFNAINPVRIVRAFDRLNQSIFFFRESLETVGRLIDGIFDKTLRVAIDFENNFTDILKTLPTEGLSDEEIEVFSNTLRQELESIASGPNSLASGIENAFETLTGIAANAGQLGIARDDITEFSETVALLTQATDLTGDNASFALARLSSLTGDTNFEALSGSLVALGNNLATTESQIFETSKRIADIDFSAKDILAFSAAISASGLEAEAGSNSFRRLITELNSGNLRRFSRVIGSDIEEFSRLLQEDATEAVLIFLDGISELNTIQRIQFFEESGLNNIRDQRLIGALATNIDTVRTAVELVNEEYRNFGETQEDFNTLQQEASRRNETRRASLNRLSNTFKGLSDTLGQVLFPVFDLTVEKLTTGVAELDQLIENNFESIQNYVTNAIAPFIELGFVLGELTFNGIRFFNQFVGFSNIFGGISRRVNNLNTNLNTLSQRLLNLSGTGFTLGINPDNQEKLNLLENQRRSILEQIEEIQKNVTDEAEEYTTITIQQGDTLWDLARQYNTEVDTLRELNNLGNSSLIITGEELIISRQLVQNKNEELELLEAQRREIENSISFIRNNPIELSNEVTEDINNLKVSFSDLRTNSILFKDSLIALASGDVQAGIEGLRTSFSGISVSLRDIFNQVLGSGSNFNTSNPLGAVNFVQEDRNLIEQLFIDVFDFENKEEVASVISDNFLRLLTVSFGILTATANPLNLAFSFIPIIDSIIDNDIAGIGTSIESNPLGRLFAGFVNTADNSITEVLRSFIRSIVNRDISDITSTVLNQSANLIVSFSKLFAGVVLQSLIFLDNNATQILAGLSSVVGSFAATVLGFVIRGFIDETFDPILQGQIGNGILNLIKNSIILLTVGNILTGGLIASSLGSVLTPILASGIALINPFVVGAGVVGVLALYFTSQTFRSEFDEKVGQPVRDAFRNALGEENFERIAGFGQEIIDEYSVFFEALARQFILVGNLIEQVTNRLLISVLQARALISTITGEDKTDLEIRINTRQDLQTVLTTANNILSGVSVDQNEIVNAYAIALSQNLPEQQIIGQLVSNSALVEAIGNGFVDGFSSGFNSFVRDNLATQNVISPRELAESLASVNVTSTESEILGNILSERLQGNYEEIFLDELLAIAPIMPEDRRADFEIIANAINQGLQEGLENNTGVTDAINSTAQDLDNSFKEYFGIQSPSTLFQEYGLNLLLGLEMGIRDNLFLVTDSFDLIIKEADKMINNLIRSLTRLRNFFNRVSTDISIIMGELANRLVFAASKAANAFNVLPFVIGFAVDLTIPKIQALRNEVEFLILALAGLESFEIFSGTPNSPLNNAEPREFGGSVNRGQIVSVLENDLPFELFTANNRTFLISGVDGFVDSPRGSNRIIEARGAGNYNSSSTTNINVPVVINTDNPNIDVDKLSDKISKNVKKSLERDNLSQRLNRRGMN